VLDVSYRNSEAVTAAANAVLKLEHARFGSVDRESTYLNLPAERGRKAVRRPRVTCYGSLKIINPRAVSTT
jgi:hypothetical protein